MEGINNMKKTTDNKKLIERIARLFHKKGHIQNNSMPYIKVR